MVHNDCDSGACYECALDESKATPMTDIDKLIEELEVMAGELAQGRGCHSEFAIKAADIITAQSARIEELEKQVEALKGGSDNG